MHWFIWCPIFEGFTTIAEVKHQLTLVDIVNLHNLIQMKADLQWMQGVERKR